jgi:hypothetical protein
MVSSSGQNGVVFPRSSSPRDRDLARLGDCRQGASARLRSARSATASTGEPVRTGEQRNVCRRCLVELFEHGLERADMSRSLEEIQDKSSRHRGYGLSRESDAGGIGSLPQIQH